MLDLESIYRETLSRCAPDRMIRQAIAPDIPRHVVAIGKCAGLLLKGLAAAMTVEDSLVVVPHGYPAPPSALRGGHPQMDEDTFAAGRELIRFVDRHDEILFLISGGGSACVEAPLEGWFSPADLIDVNARLIASALPIAAINTVRKHLSAIKGGRLAARVKRRSATLLYSDVSTGDLSAIASGPTVPDHTTNGDAAAILERVGGCDRIVTALRNETLPETVRQISNGSATVIADNRSLTRAASDLARDRGLTPVVVNGQIEEDVGAAVMALIRHARELRDGEILIAGGEPTVPIRGTGRGGRCFELGVRFALEYDGGAARALFGSSDGVDGNSGAAGLVLDLLPVTVDRAAAAAALARSDSFELGARVGRPIMILPTGNNLRDLYLVARG